MDNNYVVYVHKDSIGNIRYVGSGRKERANLMCPKSDRGILYELFVRAFGKLSMEIKWDNLSKIRSMELECKLYNSLYKSGYLLNRNRPFTKIKTIPKSVLDRLLYSESVAGNLIWSDINPFYKKNIGMPAGSLSKGGYYVVLIENKIYYSHRLVYALHNSYDFSDKVIDHIDGNKANNKISNLRAISSAENSRNKIKNGRGKLPTGVTFNKNKTKLVVTVTDPSTRTSSFNPKRVSNYLTVSLFENEDFAIEEARKLRESMLSEINNRLALGYTPTHGLKENT